MASVACWTIPSGPESEDAPPRGLGQLPGHRDRLGRGLEPGEPAALARVADLDAARLGAHAQRERLGAALRGDRALGGRAVLVQLADEVFERVERHAVDGEQLIAVLHSRGRGRPARHHLDARAARVDLHEADRRVEAADEEDRRDPVHARPGEDDQEAAPGRLVEIRPRVAVVVLAVVVGRKARDAAVAAEREPGDAVLGVAAGEAPHARAEAERVDLDAHAHPARHQHVSGLVRGDEQPEPEQRGDEADLRGEQTHRRSQQRRTIHWHRNHWHTNHSCEHQKARRAPVRTQRK